MYIICVQTLKKSWPSSAGGNRSNSVFFLKIIIVIEIRVESDPLRRRAWSLYVACYAHANRKSFARQGFFGSHTAGLVLYLI